LYHLSHIDLDGYSCQLLTSYIFKDRHYYNANYGKEVLTRVDQIFEDIEKQKKDRKIFLLLTDLNLSPKEADYLESKKQESPYDIHLQLLDHHITGLDVSERFSWYHLNDKKSATLITHEYLKRNFQSENSDIDKLDKFVKSVNALDIWLQDEVEDFEYGKVMMRLISSAREIANNLFPKVDNSYKLSLLKGAMEIYSDETITDKNIHLDNNIHHLKKNFFREDHDDTIDNLLTKFIVKILYEHRDELTVKYKGYKGLLTYSLGNTSIVGNGFLVANPDYDFFMDVSGKGNMSLRANGGVDVSVVAKELAGGGGHINASGGRIKNFKEQFIYDRVKTQIESLFIEKEYTTNTLTRKENA
jgi:oligoribonuclease NrnB/cAMP/cGMP phosphodiesterase (DHH superfamily)